MNEEEKEAIKILNNINLLYCGREDERAIETILNLVDKQQKEIEKLKSKKYIFNAETNEIKEIPISDDYISKDKIRDIIFEFIPQTNHEAKLRTKIIKLLGE